MTAGRARLLALLALVAFAGYLAVEIAVGFPSSFPLVMEHAWGRVMFADLYAGLLLAGVIIVHRERSLKQGLVWLAAILVLGNLATLAYVIHALRPAGTREEKES